MGIFEYVSVLTSIIVGLGIAHLLQGVARLVQHPGRVKVYWVHLLWVSFMFVNAIFWWWWEFRLVVVEIWTFQLYLFVSLYAVLLYLLCALLFPANLDGYSGYKDYFLSRRTWFFGCLATFFLVDIADTFLKGAEYFASLGNEYVVAAFTHVALSFVAMTTKNERFHGTFVSLALLYTVAWAFRYYETVG